MAKLELPLGTKGVPLSPSLSSLTPIEDRLVQTLALLLGYARGERVPLAASPSGVLYSASPRLTDVVHYTAAAPNAAKQGAEIVCTEILCMAHPDNTGRIWVRTRSTAAANNAFPLDKGEVMGFSVENLSELRALIVANGDTIIVGYSL